MTNMYIDPSFIVGKTFLGPISDQEYTCIGYGANETFLVVGTFFDSVNNRSVVKTFKLSEVRFKGDITSKAS